VGRIAAAVSRPARRQVTGLWKGGVVVAEWRWDGFHERWVIMSPRRGGRPRALTDAEPPGATKACPFCPGRESDTPPAVYVERAAESTWPWNVRVVPNLYGILDPMPGRPSVGALTPPQTPAEGTGEVVIETPEHGCAMADFDGERMAAVMRAYQSRARALLADERFGYVTVFKNEGRAAGASMAHSHSQIVALPWVPPRVLAEHEHTTGDCYFCRLITDERATGRCISSSEDWFAWCPYASAAPYESWITPTAHGVSFSSLDDEGLRRLGALVLRLLKGLREIHGRAPYNLFFHALPEGSASNGHWHLEIVPRLTTPGGLEWATGCGVNPVLPEEAAARLRVALR
jgi:UDPglucose--hexose-1-phosphate uridylyltransferase